MTFSSLDLLRGISFVVALAAAAPLAAVSARAEGQMFPPVDDPMVKTECSACHMAFPAGMLPARSWQAITGDLANHFGEDASLDAASVTAITDWLTANAAKPGSRVMRGIADTETPLRITETAWWTRAHQGEVNPAWFKDPKVGSKANCVACHGKGAEQGYFGD